MAAGNAATPIAFSLGFDTFRRTVNWMASSSVTFPSTWRRPKPTDVTSRESHFIAP
jgi:hypothetical protein